MEMSNVERIRFLVASFDTAVDGMDFSPPREKWDDKPSALEVATEMKEFGAAISYNVELYHGAFLKHVRNCFAKVAEQPKAEEVRTVLQSIPGFELHAQ